MQAFLKKNILIHQNIWYLPEKQWRKIDPALTAKVRKSGAVDVKQYYCITVTNRTKQLSDRYPGLFIYSGGKISADHR